MEEGMTDKLVQRILKKPPGVKKPIQKKSSPVKSQEIELTDVEIGEEVLVTRDDVPKKSESASKTIQELIGEERPPEDRAFVIIQDGGVGDAICATPMIESAMKFHKGKEIVVGSAHHEILINNPHIDHLYSLASPGDLFEKWVKPLKHFGSVIKRDIYNACAHKLFPGPLSMVWCHLYNVPFYEDNIKVYLLKGEEEEAIDFIKTFPKEVILIHPYGAKLLFDPKVQITPNKDWFPECWEQVVSELTEKYDVVQIGGPEEEPIKGVTTYLMGQTSIRQTAALIKHCLTYICIESFVGHCGAAVGKPGVVLFGRSNPYIAGHKINKNLWIPNSCEFNDLFCGRPQGYFGDSEMFRGVMRPWICPSRSCMKAIRPVNVLSAVQEIIDQTTRKNK